MARTTTACNKRLTVRAVELEASQAHVTTTAQTHTHTLAEFRFPTHGCFLPSTSLALLPLPLPLSARSLVTSGRWPTRGRLLSHSRCLRHPSLSDFVLPVCVLFLSSFLFASLQLLALERDHRPNRASQWA